MARQPHPLKAEAIHLRVKERQSLREIHEATGAPRSSLSLWLRPYPLTEAERRTRRVNRKPPRKRKERGPESKFHAALQGRNLGLEEKGRIAEAAILFRLALHGFDVARPAFEGQKADWLVLCPNGAALRLQVRWTQAKKNGDLPSVAVRCSAGRGRHRTMEAGTDYDILIGYHLFTDTAYVWTGDDIGRRKVCITIQPEAAERWDKVAGLVKARS